MRRGRLQPGPAAETIQDLWWLMLGLGTAVFLLFAALLAWGLLRSGAGDAPEMRMRPRRWILGGGVIMPTVVLTKRTLGHREQRTLRA